MGSMSGSPSPVHWEVQPIQDLPADPAVRRIQEARHCVASPILRPSARTPGGSHRGTPRPTRMAPLLEVTKVIEHHEMSKRRKVGSLFNFTSTCACSIRTARAQRTPLRVGRATRLAERARRSRPVPLQYTWWLPKTARRSRQVRPTAFAMRIHVCQVCVGHCFIVHAVGVGCSRRLPHALDRMCESRNVKCAPVHRIINIDHLSIIIISVPTSQSSSAA